MTCAECGKDFNPHDSITLCWDCWWDSAEGDYEDETEGDEC